MLGAFLTDFENQIDVVDKNDGTLDRTLVINHGKVRSKGFEKFCYRDSTGSRLSL